MPSIQLNGQPHPLESPLPLPALLQSLGLEGKPLVIELNNQALLREEYPTLTIKPGDSLEIVTLAAGG